MSNSNSNFADVRVRVRVRLYFADSNQFKFANVSVRSFSTVCGQTSTSKGVRMS